MNRLYFVLLIIIIVIPNMIFGSLTLTVKVEFNSNFDLPFTTGKPWAKLYNKRQEIKNFIIDAMNDDLEDYGITVDTTSGKITIRFYSDSTGKYGYHSPGIGSYESDNPFVEIYNEQIALSSAFNDTSKVTVSRIGTFIANTATHEVGHILGLHHAYAYEAYDPTISGALINTGYPNSPNYIPISIKNSSYNTPSHLMSNLEMSTYEDFATNDCYFSSYSDNIIDFAVNEGGTIQQNMVWSFYCRNIYEPKQDIIIPSNKTLYITGYQDRNYIYPEETWEFRNNSSLVVNGTLIVNVDSNSLPYRKPVVFDFVASSSGTLNGIKVNSGGTIKIEYAEIKNAYRGIYIKNGTHTITNNYIHNINQYGIEIDGATNTYIRDNTINNCKGGIWAYGNQTIKLHGYGLNKIEGYSSSGHAVLVTGGTAHLGEYHSKGKNSFIRNTSNTVIYNSSSNEILAEKNYWGGSPSSSWFGGSGDVAWDFPLSLPAGGVGSDLGKVSEPILTPDRLLFSEAMELADLNEHKEASKKFKELVKNYPNSRFSGLSVAWAMASDKFEKEFTKQSNYLKSLQNHSNKKVRDNYLLSLLALESETENKNVAAQIVSSVPLDGNVGVEIRLNWANDLISKYKDPESAQVIFEELLASNPSKGTIETIEALKQYAVSSANEGAYIFKKKETEDIDLVEKDEILNAYPNPFNPTTKITYQIPENRMVTLKVYNMLGQEVTTLVNEIKTSGKHTVTFNANNLPSGMYIYRIQSGNFTESKKILFLK